MFYLDFDNLKKKTINTNIPKSISSPQIRGNNYEMNKVDLPMCVHIRLYISDSVIKAGGLTSQELYG